MSSSTIFIVPCFDFFSEIGIERRGPDAHVLQHVPSAVPDRGRAAPGARTMQRDEARQSGLEAEQAMHIAQQKHAEMKSIADGRVGAVTNQMTQWAAEDEARRTCR